jgi:hypothetical protein
MNHFIENPVSRALEGACGRFRHTFGGELEHPVFPPGGKAPCHLLYTIDTDDPLFPVKIDGVRMLPLIYCQQYNAAAMGYRVTGNGIEIDYIESLEWMDDFPYDHYPSSFPRRDIRLEKIEDEGARLLNRYIDAYARDWDTTEACEKDLKSLGYPFTQFGGRHMMWQDIPDVVCPACNGSSMGVFGVVWNVPVKGVYLWDDDPEYREDNDVQIIYQICSDCSAIHVCNRCT